MTMWRKTRSLAWRHGSRQRVPAESMAAEKAIKKAGLSKEQLDFLFAGYLLGQLIATSFGLIELERPVFGVYGACSTIGESLASGIHGPVRAVRAIMRWQ